MIGSWTPLVVALLVGLGTFALLRRRARRADATSEAPWFGDLLLPIRRPGRHTAPRSRTRTLVGDAAISAVATLLATALWLLLPGGWPTADGSDPGPAPALPPRQTLGTDPPGGNAGASDLGDPVTTFDDAVTVRGIFGRDTSSNGFANVVAAGFNTVMVQPDVRALDQLAELGLQGVVWLGDYDTGTKCGFDLADEEVRRAVTAVARHPAVIAYYLADEPSLARAEGCPDAPEDIRLRSELVKGLDPDTPTFVTLTTWDGVEEYPFGYWAGTADIFGLVVYPCFQGRCDFSMIDAAVAEADAAGLDDYWAIVQDFSTAWYDLPAPAAVDAQLTAWAESRMTGYVVYAAGGFSCCRGSDFETNPAKLAVLERWNRS